MIDYDNLRIVAQVAKDRQQGEVQKVITYINAFRPDTVLRLLDIVAVAKRGLREASVCNDDYHASKTALDEIAKIENE